MRLKNKVAVITGGSQGIGAAYVRRFVAEGAKVAIGDIQDKEGQDLARELGPAASYVHCDVTREGDVAKLMDEALSVHGGLDIAVANAGIVDSGSIMESDEAMFDRMMAINVKGVFFTCRQAARRMIARKTGGVLINISSIVAILGEIGEGCYPVSKGAVGALTRTLAVELADHNIRVVAIGPAGTRTAMMADAAPGSARLRNIELRTPMRRMGEPEEMAGVAVFLASDDASYITGQTIFADGGRLVLNLNMKERG
ncbi:MAG: SDR family NAD(P)-dependent oxidoreductase [Alphaproteobacteria bacterium]